MPYTPHTPIRGSSRGNANDLARWANDRGCLRPNDVQQYLDTVYDLAPRLDLNPDVVVAQSILETSENGSPWASHWWRESVNPAGIGITGDKVQNLASRDFGNGEAAARAHLLHLSLYVHGKTVPDGFTTSEDPRWDAAIQAGYAGIATTLDDLVGTWAEDAVEPNDPLTYADKIAARLDAMEDAGLLAGTGRPDPHTPQIPDGYTEYEWPGLENPVYLPDWIDVELKIIPKKKGWTSGIPSNAHVKTSWHDTGNDKTNADDEWAFANNGRPGVAAASYNGIFDDRKVIICQRFDELVGHAGNDEACRTSYAFEQAWGWDRENPVDFEKSLEVGAAVHAAVCVAKGWKVDTALVQHNYWPQGPKGEHKNCPGQIRRKNIWSTVVKETAAAAERVRGFPKDPGPKYPAPSPIPALDAISSSEGIAPFRVHDPSTDTTYIWVGDRARATQKTGRYRTEDIDGDRVGPDIRQGEEFDVDFMYSHGGEWWFYTPYGTRIREADVERIRDYKGAEEA